MEDDIDIEEHDVLDNPKIRDIFPDLSIVKTEVPDEEILDQYEENQDVGIQFEYPVNIKNEVVSDEENVAQYEYGQSEQSTLCADEQNMQERSRVYPEQSTPCADGQNMQGPSCVYPETEQSTLCADEQNMQERSCVYPEIEQSTSCADGQNMQEQSCVYPQMEKIQVTSHDYEQNDTEDIVQPGETEFQYSNKIILGTKPTDYDVLYEEALHSRVSVVLENWEVKLKYSSCFCKSCDILFPTENALDFHNSISHSFLVALKSRPNTARKSTVNTSSTYCNHCDKTFPNDTALIKHLYELLPLNNFQKPTPQPVKVESKAKQFKCIKCKKYFATLSDGKRHKKLAHPTMANVNIIVRVVNNVEKPKPTPTPVMPKKESEAANTKTVSFSPSLVPKSILFQCHICQINFLSCYSTIQHSNKCDNQYNFHRCQICKRKIRLKDVEIHELQHKYTEKLKIYTIHRSIMEKVLLKCPKCSVCFDEKAFWCHRKTCDGNEVGFHCKICLIDISQYKFENHKLAHTTKKYTKKDFIIVEFCDTTKMTKEVDQIQRNVQPKPMERSTDTDVTLYYCSTCGSYRNVFSLRGHMDGTCKNLSLKFCDICGLGFGKNTYKLHLELHKKRKLLTLRDFKIISLQSRKYIEPPLPNYHRCSTCNIHFLTKEETRIHLCDKEAFQTCKICNKKYSLKAMLPHSNFHNYTPIPELLKKYNSIDNIWNVIYMCVACDLVSPSYDSAVEHSQNHINYLKRPPSKLCNICDFDIMENAFKSHMTLHENNRTINKRNFTILKYDFKHIFSTEWMNMLAPLEKQHKYQILSKSIYRYTRRFKLNIAINCRTEDLKYFCNRCKTSVNPPDIKQHYLDKKCKHSSKFICKTCNMKFLSLFECVSHENEHESVQKSYKIITFNDQKDEIFDQRLKDYELKVNKTIKTAETSAKIQKPPIKLPLKKLAIKKLALKKATLKKSAIKKSAKRTLWSSKVRAGETTLGEALKTNRIKLYKCEKCKACISRKHNIHKHVCTAYENRVRLCKICNEYFYNRHLLIHNELHKALPKLPKKPLIIYFNPDIKALPIATIFQCECGLHFTTKMSIENHFNVCGNGQEISKEMCSKCNLLFPTDVLVSHLCKHHSKPVDIQIEKVVSKKKKPYQCATCNVVYLTASTFEDHLFSCPIKMTRKCPKCNYLFDHKTYRTHPCTINQEVTVVQNTAAVVKVYRCHACDITYLYKTSYDYHLLVEHVSHREIVSCAICELRFTGQILAKHMVLHDSNENFIIKVFEPATGNSSIIKGINFKLDGKSSKLKDSVLNTSKKAIKSSKKNIQSVDLKTPITIVEKKASPKMSTKVTDQKLSTKLIGLESTTNSVITVYRCSTCDISYLYKRRLKYHFEVNHVTKRVVKPCKVCGLKFVQNVLDKHERMHKVGGTYEINVLELDGDEFKTTVLTGNNLLPDDIPKPANKRRSRFTDDITSPKRAKMDESENIADKNASANLVEKGYADQASTSKFDFQSVNINDDNTTIASDDESVSVVENVNDPLNNSSELILPDVTANNLAQPIDKNFLSTVLKKALDAKFNKFNNNLYICRHCDLHFLTEKALETHLIRAAQRKQMPIAFKCDYCGLKFSQRSLPRHVYVHHKRMNLDDESLFDIIDLYPKEANDASKDTQSVSVETEESSSINNKKIHYFKCADCNVCYLDENSCRKHSLNHSLLDPITYIECKVCNFQFLVDSLKKHMNLHHSTSEFNLDDLVVTEYTATDDEPKIDVYPAIDKVQSRLVSTTTDMAVDTVDSSVSEIVGI